MRFGLKHLFYAMALLASSLSLFGAWGVLPAAIVLIAWGYVFAGGNHRTRLFHVCLYLFFSCCLIGLLLPTVSTAREAARQNSCANTLKHIALAMHNYADVYGSFPPAYVADANGKPMHSWRVLILPYLGEQPLYDTYRFDEPWDGPNNRLLEAQIPSIYLCPSDKRNRLNAKTSYLAVVGDETSWPGDRGRKLDEFPDDAAHTILLVESHAHDIHWMEPRDWNLQQAVGRLSGGSDYAHDGHEQQSFFYEYEDGRMLAFADGHVHYTSTAIDGVSLRSLLLIDDDAPQAHSEFPDYGMSHPPRKRFRYESLYRLLLFAAMVFLPLPWVWRQRTGASEQASTGDAGA